MGARAPHQRRAAPHALLLRAHAHGAALPAVRRQPGGAPPRVRGGAPAPAQPLLARRALSADAQVLRGVPLRADGSVGARGAARAGVGVPRARRRRAATRPAPVEAALCRRTVRPDKHGAHRVRPGDVREDRAHVPGEPRAPRRRPAPAGRLAAAMRARRAVT